MISRLVEDLDGYDVCIVGAGPAGLVIASELAYSGLRLCVLESGSDTKTAFADKLKEVRSEGLPIKPASRERRLGGAGNVWGGLSAPLDPIDLRAREWTEGWPLEYHELEQYFTAAVQYGFPAPEEFANVAPFWPWQELEEKHFLAMRPPYNFARLRTIFNREGVDLFLGATVVKLGSDGMRIAAVECKTPGATYRVRARIFVVAAGGIENPRLLLLSDVGNAHRQVGRYFMNHPKGYAGRLRLARRLPGTSPYVPRSLGGRMRYAGLMLSESLRRRGALLSSYVQFEPDSRLLARYALGVWRRLPPTAAGVFNLLRPRTVRLRWYADMEPRADNRVELTREIDVLGTPLPRVSATLGQRDTDTLRALYTALDQETRRLGIGTVEGSVEDVLAAVRDDASHHMGTTRMGRDPRRSVVDPDCKVHGTENLYVAGTSVFPTAGSANPTYTMVALAIRLARHIARAQEPAAPAPRTVAGRNRIIVVGAGRRVAEDVLPALESLPEEFRIEGIFARHPRRIFGGLGRYDEPLSNLSEARLAQAAFVYLAVPPEALSALVEQLAPLTKAAFVIDTPVRLSGLARHTLQGRTVHVAEDSVFLPWLSLVGRPRFIEARHSLYRYHGIALLRALGGGGIFFGMRLGRLLWLRVGGLSARVHGPRDYARGTLVIDGQQPELKVTEGRCSGFVWKDSECSLSPEESALAGYMELGDTVVSRMLELKRVGLRRLLSAAARGERTWSLKDGAGDARADSWLNRVLFYFSTLL